MNYLRLTILMLSMALLGACAQWQTAPVYSQTQTPTQTQTNAQGSAADYAAMANITFNCPSCTDAQKDQLMRYMLIKYNEGQQGTKVMDKGAQSDLAEITNWRLGRALDQALFRLLQDSY